MGKLAKNEASLINTYYYRFAKELRKNTPLSDIAEDL